MKYSGISFISLLIVISCLIGSIYSQCCLKFNGAECVACPDNMHLYRGNCIYNLPFCKSYSNGFDCSECNDGYKLENLACILITKVQQKTVLKPQPKPENPKTQPPKQQQPKPQPPKQYAKPQQKKPQPTTQAKDYKEFTITLPLDTSGTNERSQRALVVDQILKSTYAEIRKADIVKATDRVYTDNSKVVELVYRVNGQGKTETLYQGLMIADLDTFIFKEVSFKKVEDKPAAVVDNGKPNSNTGSSSANPQGTTQQVNNTQQIINTQNQQNTQQKFTTNQQQQNVTQQSTEKSIPNKQPESQPSADTPSQPIPTLITPSSKTSEPNKIPSSSVQSPTQPQKTSIITVSGSPQDEYSAIKFVQLSDMDALIDINFVVALNQINNKLPDLEGLIPTVILAELGYNTSKLSVVHYIITFDIEEKNKVDAVQEVRLKVITATSQVKIDSVVKKQPKKSSPPVPNSSPNTAKSPDSVIQSLTGDTLSQRSSYTEISSNPAQADIFFLIFLDNLGKGLQKKLTQNGKKPEENEIVYAGRFDSKDMIHFWVETRVTCANGTKSLFKVTGTENKMTYEVKINEIVPIEEKKGSTNSTQQKKEVRDTKVQNVSNKNTTQNQVVTVEVPKKFQQPKQYISGSPINTAATSTAPTTPTKPATQTTPTIVVPTSPTNPVTPSANTNPESRTTNQVSNSATAVSPGQKQPPNTSMNQAQPAQPQPNNPAPPTVVNVPAPSKPVVVPVPAPQPPAPPKPQQPFSSKTFSDINQTIRQKAGGLDQIDPKLVQTDDGVLRSVETMLAGRPNRENMKLYKAYIKNFGIKAEYKIYMMDLVSRAPKIEVSEGYVTYDLMRKRIFVISFGSLGL